MKTPIISISGHCVERMRERQIPIHDFEAAVRFGTQLRLSSATACYVRRRDIPEWVPERQARRIENIVVIARDGCALTTYRDTKFLRHHKRQNKWH